MNRKIRIAQFGLGPIGIESLRLAAAKGWAEVVGGIDIDPAKVGKSLGEVTGIDAYEKQRVYADFAQMIAEIKPDVVLHTAGSKADQTIAQIEPMIAAGISVASTCEELLFPMHRAPEATKRIDALCKQTGAKIIGTGVNPGFVMDVLPVCMTGVSREVDHIYVERIVNASTRRMPLQKKIGSGMDPDEFRALFKAGKAGHAGFQESLCLICHAMGWKISRINESCDPVIADHDIQTNYFSVKMGQTCGLHQRVEAIVGDDMPVVMDLQMYLDAADPHDLVRIEGDPPLEVRVNGGVAGDHATVAALINVVPRLLKSEAGVRLMTDLAVPCIC